MDKLANYGSDDDYEDSPQNRKTEYRTGMDRTPHQRQSASEADVNYEEVQMELSEDSSGSSSNEDAQRPTNDRSGRRHSKDGEDDRSRRCDKPKGSPKYDGKSRRDDDNDHRSRRDSDDQRSRREDDEDRHRSRANDRRVREDRNSRDRDRNRERNRDDKYRDKHRDEKDRYRDSRRSRRSSSRERQRSRSPRRPDYRGRRSSSRERGYSRRYDRASNKMAQLEKLDLQRSMDSEKRKGEPEKDRFFMPGITGRFREQIERRKMLWQKKAPEPLKQEPVQAAATGSSGTGRVWQTTTFAQDSDGKVANKFKRLMGIRETAAEPKPATDILKKQEEMFSSMEQQYEVARTATHTMRGVGLGFGSFQR